MLATAVVDDPELRLAFPDGVAWLVLGRSMAGAGSIKPSPTGVPPAPAGDHKGHGEERIAWTGKISAIVYDQFGDFEGFRLATEDCERPMTARLNFPSRPSAVIAHYLHIATRATGFGRSTLGRTYPSQAGSNVRTRRVLITPNTAVGPSGLV